MTTLKTQVSGPVFVPGDPGHKTEAATFNLLTPLHPAFVVAAESAADVQAAVRWTGAHDLPEAVRGGRHL